jgi:hypothetical protein
MGPEVMDKFRKEFKAAWERDKNKPPVLLDPLPLRVRFRLQVIRRVDRLCFRLVDTGHYNVAVLIWRACGMW